MRVVDLFVSKQIWKRNANHDWENTPPVKTSYKLWRWWADRRNIFAAPRRETLQEAQRRTLRQSFSEQTPPSELVR